MELDEAYTELGLARHAAEAEVKAAWRRLVSQWHPDRNGSQAALARMQRINLALDRIRAAGFAAPAQTAVPDVPVRTVYRKLKLSLEEAALGCTRVLSGRHVDPCAPCSGAGGFVRAGACAGCAGTGLQRAPLWFSLFGADTECTVCRGSGAAREACSACAGTGTAPPRPWRQAVRIPAGVRSGDVLGVEGQPPRKGQAAVHLELRIDLQPHPLFTLDEQGQLQCCVPVDGFSWIAQRTVEVPTLDGMQPLPLQREQLSYRLPGRGFPVERRGVRGDALVEIEPVFPQRFSVDQQILLDQLIASVRGTGTAPGDARLADWQQAVQRWQRQP